MESIAKASENPAEKPEEEKSPEEILLDAIYDKEKPKSERAELIKNKLATEREGFYELDLLMNNYFSHIIENFNEPEDEELFKDLVNTVLDDMETKNYYLEINNKNQNLYDITVSGYFYFSIV